MPPSINWLAGEKAVFRLFFQVQSQLVKKDCHWRSEFVQGNQLIKSLFAELLAMTDKTGPVVLSSASIVSTILEVLSLLILLQVALSEFAALFRSLLKSWQMKIFHSLLLTKYLSSARRILTFNWGPIITGMCGELADEKMQSVLRSRHEASLALLSSAIEKVEKVELEKSQRRMQQNCKQQRPQQNYAQQTPQENRWSNNRVWHGQGSYPQHYYNRAW